MCNTSLTDSYLKLSGLDSALSKLVSEFAATQLQSSNNNALKLNKSEIILFVKETNFTNNAIIFFNL